MTILDRLSMPKPPQLSKYSPASELAPHNGGSQIVPSKMDGFTVFHSCSAQGTVDASKPWRFTGFPGFVRATWGMCENREAPPK